MVRVAVTEDFQLWHCVVGVLTIGISVRGDLVVAAPPAASWAIGRRWPFVREYYTRKRAVITKCDLTKHGAPVVSSGPVKSVDPRTVVVAQPPRQDLSWLHDAAETEGESQMASRKRGAAAEADKPKKSRTSKKPKGAIEAGSKAHTAAAEAAGQQPLTFQAPAQPPQQAAPFTPQQLAALTPAQVVATITPIARQRPFVQRVVSNAKGGVDVVLGRLTFIYGPNSSEKSAIVNALEAALVAEVLEKIELFKAPENHEALKVHKLKGKFSDCYSFSVNYKFRIVFEYSGKRQATLLLVGDHDVYR